MSNTGLLAKPKQVPAQGDYIEVWYRDEDGPRKCCARAYPATNDGKRRARAKVSQVESAGRPWSRLAWTVRCNVEDLHV